MNSFGNQNKSKEYSNKKINNSKEQIISKAFSFHSKVNINEAEKYYRYFINQGFEDYRVSINYAIINFYLRTVFLLAFNT